MIAYYNGQFTEEKNISVSPYDRGFQFADGIYETLRTYNGSLFMFEEHIKRLNHNLKELRINYDGIRQLPDQIKNIANELAVKNNFIGKEFSLYIQITRGAYYPRVHVFPPSDIKPTEFISISLISKNIVEYEKGIKVILVDDFRWSRCDIKAIGLLPSVLAKQQAIEKGASESIWIRDGLLLEGSHTNLFGVMGNKVITSPLSNYILPGITREVVIALCKELSIVLEEIPINKNEIKNFDEFFVTGTLTEIKPVVQIDNLKIGNGKPGIITANLQSAFTKFTLGN